GADHLLDRSAPTGAKKIVRIMAFRQAGKLQAFARPDQRQRQIAGAIGGTPPAGVAVEAKRRLAGDAPAELQLLGGERGAARRLGQVEIVGLRVRRERAPAEGDRAPAQIGDGKHYAIAETIVGNGNVIARDEQARLDHLLGRYSLIAEMLLECKALGRCIAEAE